MHEASQHRNNRFVTLTYDDNHVPSNNHLQLTDVQKWLKRLRKSTPNKIRYILAGEYGETTRRPHYHALIFGHKWDDEKQAGKDLYSSQEAEATWQKGAVRIGKVTGASANYVAQYTVKDTGWRPLDQTTGELGPRPFLTMSRRPGIGIPWYAKFKTDLHNGYLITDGAKGAIPRAYRKYIKEETPLDEEEIQYLNYLAASRRQKPTAGNLAAGEVIHEARRKLTARLTL